MAENMSSSPSWLWRLAPFAAMVTVECTNVGVSVLNKAALSQGMSPYVSVVYFNALASFIFLPLFFFYNRKNAAPVTFSLLFVFFLLGLIGSCSQMLCLAAVKLSSPTLASAITNLTPIFTFLLAVITRMESLDLRKSSSQAKCVGAIVSVAGAFTATLYKGSAIIRNQPANYSNQLLNPQKQEWILAGLLLLIVCLLFATANVAQGALVKQYPHKMTIVFFVTLFTTIHSAVFALVLEKNPKSWTLESRVDIVAIVLTAIFGIAFRMSIHTWCLQKKGPVYVAMFMPLGVAVAAFMTFFFLGETLYLGSVIGSVMIVAGFYSVIWGQIEEKSLPIDVINSSQAPTTPSTMKAPLLHPTSSAV